MIRPAWSNIIPEKRPTPKADMTKADGLIKAEVG